MTARSRIALLVALASVALAVLLAGAPPAAAQSTESEILSVTVEATVNTDGSMDVVEVLAYDFTAERNGGFRSFVPGFGDYQIVDFRVTEDGEPRDLAPGFDEPNSGTDVRWFGSADHSKVTGRHDYTLRYTVLDAVDVFADTAVLNWQFIGEDFPSLEQVSVDVTFPPDSDGELRAFAHGVLHGVVEPRGDTVSLRVAGNPAGQFVEARILVPAEVFDVVARPEAVLDQILAEEAAFADAANAQRELARAEVERAFEAEVEAGLPGGCPDGGSSELARRCRTLEELLEEAEPRVGRELTFDDADLLLAMQSARADVDDELTRLEEERNRTIFQFAGPVVAIAGVAGAYAIWRRWGKDPERPQDVGEYHRELPPEPPAVIASLDDWGGVDSKALAATIVDLAQRGWLTITPEGDDHRFTRTQKADGEPLADFEAGVLWRLFPLGRATVTQDELLAEARRDRTVSAAWMRGFRAQVKADYDRRGYHVKNGCAPWLLWFLVVSVVGLVGAAGLGWSAWVGGGVAVVTASVLFLLSPLLRRRTPVGTRKLAEAQGLKKFLEDFSLVDDVPVGHLSLYERYLVYAVALGVADRLIAGLRMRFPEVANDPSFATWYGHSYVAAGFPGGGGGFDRLGELSTIDSFAGDFSRATAAAFSPPSSSGGGGGGFSGGGGSSGGGGGGGAGSW